LLTSRMLLGVYLGQYCINTLTYFFVTWFPIYLVKDRGLSILEAGFAAAAPALFGFVGGILGGYASDRLLARTGSLTMARKLPLLLGMLLATSIIGLANQHRLPSIWEVDTFTRAGGLMSYGPSFADMYRRSAGFVAKILKGANPGDLPLEQPTRFELVVNMRTARLLGLTFPQSFLARADELIE